MLDRTPQVRKYASGGGGELARTAGYLVSCGSKGPATWVGRQPMKARAETIAYRICIEKAVEDI